MPFIDGIGDEVVYAAVVAAPIVIYCSSAGIPILVKKGFSFTKNWLGEIWNLAYGHFSTRRTVEVPNLNSYSSSMDSPLENDCCSICHDSFTLPCQANCAHWFCGECILRVWQHTAALQPCKCPICRRPINLLIPSRTSNENLLETDSERILREISKYNRIFGGGPVSLIQRIRDMPLLLRRLGRELLDPRRALFLLHRTRIVLLVVFSASYVFSPFDLLPEAILGIIGLLDDALVVVFALFYISTIYRRILVQQHGA